MKCPEFTASQFDLYFALFAADIYRKLMLLSCKGEARRRRMRLKLCLVAVQCSHMLSSSSCAMNSLARDVDDYEERKVKRRARKTQSANLRPTHSTQSIIDSNISFDCLKTVSMMMSDVNKKAR